MTDVWFYILAGSTLHDRHLFLCRLTEKVLTQGKSVYIHCGGQQHARQLDDLLWTWRPHAFLPHSLVNDDKTPESCRVWIGWEDEPGQLPKQPDVMINLNERLPEFFGRFERLVEIVIQDDQILADTRHHYRILKDRGYPVTHQDMRERA